MGRNQSEHPTPLYMILEAAVENWRVHLRSTYISVTVVSLPRPFREKRIIVYFCYSFFIIIRPSLYQQDFKKDYYSCREAITQLSSEGCH